MKEYLMVVLVTIVCVLAIVGAWFWRKSQEPSISEVENKIEKYVDIYKEKVNVYSDIN